MKKKTKKTGKAKKTAKAKNKPKRKLLKRTQWQLLHDQLDTLKPIVAEILAKDTMSRDDDNRLVIEVWKKQGMKENETFKNLKYKLIRNNISTPESICRTRRGLQENHPQFRGTIYYCRQEAADKVRKEMSKQGKLF